MNARWTTLELSKLINLGDGWTYPDDSGVALRLAASVRRYGQLRPIVVRQTPDGPAIVDGRRLAAVLRDAGFETAAVVDLGDLDADTSARVALALEVRFGTDYAKVATAVAGLMERGASAGELEAASPFTAERIGHFPALAMFDWSRFAEPGQKSPSLDFDDADPVVSAAPAPSQQQVSPVAAPAPPHAPPAPQPVYTTVEGDSLF